MPAIGFSPSHARVLRKIQLKDRSQPRLPAVSRRVTTCAASSNGAQTDTSASETAYLQIIKAALAGDLPPEQAAREIAQHSSGMSELETGSWVKDGGKKMDVIPELVWGTGKTPDQVTAAMMTLGSYQRSVLATRIEPDMYAAVRKLLPEGISIEYNARAKTLSMRSPNADDLPKPQRLPGTVAVVSGYSSDLSVAEECRLVAEYFGCYVFKLNEIRVASLHRVLANLEAIRAADVVVVVAGLDGALPTVLAGLVEAPVIAVPTSAGYGASLQGMAALLASLSSSTPISVVNIDDGRAAAMMATRILRQSQKMYHVRTAAEAAAAAAAAAAVPAAPSTPAKVASHNGSVKA
mmetsp:Transcript_23590/g.51763  ORF Transcript_23590/g.51763 Transcript_23590/m.51763 type:complete len:351 (+) Transcript_23590:188-1240(+)|eukprot:CAMPEP_0202921358 /NCGR_PEP_ID=MMETSP1392-20130828/77352_1 /ASSEMBLY_ACC=CAM_ASM_000868 /TAXON_ID=225041 /ORGANISM="Chlamydomonas chlamydogama, Strain SAG 11-48b" /LENGTH=350 /DNA_ID=CAMNT_0049614923 /DNA_START=166 /DNA_END=1218 /DNA_ORIENTATION=-